MPIDKPLILDTRYLRPLPKEMFDSACEHCDKRQSKWEMGPPDSDERHILCSLCFLYESNWGKARVDQIHEIVDDVEKEMGTKFFRGADGKTLIACKDGDRILGALALTSRAFQLEDRMRRETGDEEPEQAN